MNYQKYYSNQIHSSSLLCQLAQMWRTQMLCDAVIKTGNVTTKAHRLVLVAACPMLQSMDNASIGSHLEVRLASEIKQDSINMFLQYLYEGFMLLTEENARDIEKIARLLQVDSVIKCCADFNKSLHEKTGLPVYSPAQYKYTFHDMLEFKHVRVSGIQKSMLEGAMKRNASEFSRPGSPGGKRQRMHRPGSPSLEGASHRADDTQSMSDSYRSSHQPAEPWDRVPRLGSGMSRGRNIQPGVIEIIEDSLELVQTEPVEKDPVTGRPIESRQPAQKSVAISVASQVTGSDPDLQIINVTGGGGGEGGSHSQPASTSTTSTSSSRGNRTVSDPSQSSSASGRGGDMQSSPRISSSERSFMMAGPSPRTDHQRHLQVQHQQFQNEQQRIQQQNAFGGFGQIELEAVSHIPGLTKPKPPESHHSIPQKNQFSHGPPVLQSKPFAAGSAHQVTAQSSAAPPSSQGSSSSVVSQISIPPISPVTSESSPFSGSMASPGSKNRNVPTSSSRTDSIERPSSVERPKDTSSKPKSGPSTPVTDESTPDISIVKVESTEKVIDTITGELSDTGGLDMFVDTHGDEGMPPQVLDDDNDQTYEGSDYDVEEPPGEGSNEGSNLSGDQNSSWYLNTMKGPQDQERPMFLLPDTFHPSGRGKTKYLSGTMKRTERDVNFIKGWLRSNGLPFDIEDMEDFQLNQLLVRFYGEARTRGNKPLTRHTLANYRSSLNRYLSDLPSGYKEWQSLLRNPQFSTSNSILDGRVHEERAREKALKSRPLSAEDLQKLLTSNVIGTGSPLPLQRKVWLDLVLHFGIKGNQAMWHLTKESFIIGYDELGRKYFEINRTSELARLEINSEMKDWFWSARMYEIPGSLHCPVASLCRYLSLLHPDSIYLFQRVIEPNLFEQNCWYQKQIPLQNVNRMLAEISKDAKLSTIYTNTSLRSTQAELLVKYGLTIDVMFPTKNETGMTLFPEEIDHSHVKSNFIHKTFYSVYYPEFKPEDSLPSLNTYVTSMSSD